MYLQLLKKVGTAILVMILWNLEMFYGFDLPQVKRNLMSGIYNFVHEFRNELLSVLRL